MRLEVSRGLEEEPGAALRLVDPNFQKARGRDVVRPVAQAVRRKHAEDERLVVFAQLAQHVPRINEFGVVVGKAL